MAPSFEYLFLPLRIRSVEKRKRLLSTGHQSYLAKGGVPSPEMVAYHERRARGGVGLIITESSRMHASGMSDAPDLNASDDRCIPGYAAIAKAVRKHGGRVFGQLSHPGKATRRIKGGMRAVTFAPSAIPDNRFHTMPREMPLDMIGELVVSCGMAARRLAEAGLDGIEIVASHGMLFAEFLNANANVRTDRYGGSFENRMRFLTECLAAVRANVGDMVVGMRISADEVEADGLHEDDVLAVCKELARTNALDYINTTLGSMTGPGGSIHVVPPMGVENAYVAPQAGKIRAATGLPVFVAGRINQPQIAEQVLRAGLADMCGMTRAMITDPDMPNKAAEGRLDDIRACIGCNQACIGHYHAGYSISCIQNPLTGREHEFGELTPTTRAKTILVAGGGPAGMRAAVTAAERGHRVILCEAGRQLGGQALLGQLLPDRSEFGGLVTNLEAEIKKLNNIDVRLQTKVDRALVEMLAPDEIIVATGAKPYEPPLEGREDGHVVGAWNVLAGGANLGSSVLVADWRADWIGMGLAEMLVLAGHKVQLAVNAPHAGYNLQLYVRDHWMAKLDNLGITVIPNTRIYGVDGTTAYLVHALSGNAVVREDVDTVVLATGHAPVTMLEKELNGLDLPIHLAGDCLSPRTVEEALYEGFLIGRSI